MSLECGYWKLVVVPLVKTTVDKIFELLAHKKERDDLRRENACLWSRIHVLLDTRKRLILLVAFLIFDSGLTAFEISPHKINLALFAVAVSVAFLVCCEDFGAVMGEIALVARRSVDSIRSDSSAVQEQPKPQVVKKPEMNKRANTKNFPRAA